MSPISSISHIAPIEQAFQPNIAAPGTTAKPSFQDVFNSAVQHVEASRANADQAAQNFMNGGAEELHSTILAAQNAELDFEMFMQVRNKVVSAYEEIMKMQL
jgi:flagellar hook-basal body complex protein FliE